MNYTEDEIVNVPGPQSQSNVKVVQGERRVYGREDPGHALSASQEKSRKFAQERSSEGILSAFLEDIVQVAEELDMPFFHQSKGTQQEYIRSTCMCVSQIQEQMVEEMQFIPQEQIVGMPFAQLQEAAVVVTRDCRTH